MKALLLVFVLSISAAAAATPCRFYLQKAADLGCSETGYLANFGYRYCIKFLNRQWKYTPSGQAFLIRNRTCLMKSLKRASQLSCTNVKSIAEASHVKCYLQSGYCSLPADDRVRIALTVWPQIFDPGFSSAMNQVLSACDHD